MKQNVKNWIIAGIMAVSLSGVSAVVASPYAWADVGNLTVDSSAGCNQRLLTFPAWYRGLLNADCDIKQPDSTKGGISTFIWTIVLNVIELMLQLVGYIAVGFIIVGGFKFLTSVGSPDGIAKSRKTITNAVVGLIISLFSVAIVNVIVGALK